MNFGAVLAISFILLLALTGSRMGAGRSLRRPVLDSRFTRRFSTVQEGLSPLSVGFVVWCSPRRAAAPGIAATLSL
eukprot:6379759-Pyramimonas_sp.AAC.1